MKQEQYLKARLSEIYAEKRKNGLVDVKFDVAMNTKTVFQDLAQEVIDLEDAIAAGQFTPLCFNDFKWKPAYGTDQTSAGESAGTPH